MNEKDIDHRTRILKGWKSLGYGSGVIGHLAPLNFINSILVIFYGYAIGLDMLWVNLGAAVGVLTNALATPIFGYLSDVKKPGKWGKRKPFLLLGLPFMIIFNIILWFSPRASHFGEANFIIISFLFISMFLFHVGYSMVRSPYLALLPEISTDSENRVKVASIQGVFGIIAIVIAILLPLLLQSMLIAPDDIYVTPSDVNLLYTVLPVLGVFFGIITVVFTLFPYFSADENYCEVESCEAPKIGLGGVMKEIFKPFKDTEYRKFLLSAFFVNAGLRLITKMLGPYFSYVLDFQGMIFTIFMVMVFPFAVIGFLLWSRRAKTKGLKKTYLQSTLILSIFLASTFFLLFEISIQVIQVMAYIIVSGALFTMVTGFIVPNPIISEMVDNAPEAFKKQAKEGTLSGSYFGTYTLMINLGYVVADLIIGMMLAGERAENGYFIGLLFPIGAVLYFLAVIVFWNAKIK
ncbi:MAG: MFS transporter [Candidatus Hodarchaeota archaeon]